MIQIDKNGLQYEGTKLTLVCEFILILNKFLTENVIDVEELPMIMEIAKLSDEELQKEAQEGTLEFLTVLTDLYGADAIREFFLNLFNK